MLKIALTEAQRRAKQNYEKKVKNFVIKFYPNNELDNKLFNYLQSKDERNKFIKDLLEKAMLEEQKQQ